jgi:hypothetical protein
MGFKHHVRHSPSSKEEVHVGYIPKAISGFKLPGVGSSGQKEGLMLDPKYCIVGKGVKGKAGIRSGFQVRILTNFKNLVAQHVLRRGRSSPQSHQALHRGGTSISLCGID